MYIYIFNLTLHIEFEHIYIDIILLSTTTGHNLDIFLIYYLHKHKTGYTASKTRGISYSIELERSLRNLLHPYTLKEEISVSMF